MIWNQSSYEAYGRMWMKIYINELGHMIKMAAMPIDGKKKLKKPSSLELMDWWPWNMVCSIRYSSSTKSVPLITLGWRWSFYGKVKYGKMLIHWISWKVLNVLEKKMVIRVVLMSTLSFECFGEKMVIRVVLMSTLRFMSRRGQGHCLTFDPGLS